MTQWCLGLQTGTPSCFGLVNIHTHFGLVNIHTHIHTHIHPAAESFYEVISVITSYLVDCHGDLMIGELVSRFLEHHSPFIKIFDYSKILNRHHGYRKRELKGDNGHQEIS